MYISENSYKTMDTGQTDRLQNVKLLYLIKVELNLYKNVRESFAAGVALGVMIGGLLLFPFFVQNGTLSSGLHWAFLILILALGSSFSAWWINPRRASHSVDLSESIARYQAIDRNAYQTLHKENEKYGGINPKALKYFIENELTAIKENRPSPA